jgi:hypothetical protein
MQQDFMKSYDPTKPLLELPQIRKRGMLLTLDFKDPSKPS